MQSSTSELVIFNYQTVFILHVACAAHLCSETQSLVLRVKQRWCREHADEGVKISHAERLMVWTCSELWRDCSGCAASASVSRYKYHHRHYTRLALHIIRILTVGVMPLIIKDGLQIISAAAWKQGTVNHITYRTTTTACQQKTDERQQKTKMMSGCIPKKSFTMMRPQHTAIKIHYSVIITEKTQCNSSEVDITLQLELSRLHLWLIHIHVSWYSTLLALLPVTPTKTGQWAW